MYRKFLNNMQLKIQKITECCLGLDVEVATDCKKRKKKEKKELKYLNNENILKLGCNEEYGFLPFFLNLVTPFSPRKNLNVHGCFAYMHVCAYAMPVEARKWCQITKSGVTNSCVLPCGHARTQALFLRALD